MGAGFGPELDWEKLWRDQVSGAKMTETNGNKLVFFLGIQRQPLAPKVRPWEAGFGSESDWEKLWRDQVSGAKMTETNGNKLAGNRRFFARGCSNTCTQSHWSRDRLGKAVAGPGGSVWRPKCDHGRLVLDVRGEDDRDKWTNIFCLGIQKRLAPKVNHGRLQN